MRVRQNTMRCEPGEANPAGCEWHPQHYFCRVCDGFYGAPHDGIHDGASAHPRSMWQAEQCACRPCKRYSGRE